MRKIIAVVGETGTGKSKLAIALAKKFNGEVINADALQVYKGLDIATNKVLATETEGVPHHLMSFVDIREEYTVQRFVNDSLATVSDIYKRGRIPIVVGGTHYYIQSLLWEDHLVFDRQVAQQSKITAIPPIDDLSAEELYAKLKELDPPMALRWHPNETRKIRRSLQIYFETGRRHSDIILEQQARPRRSRFDPLLFWVHTDVDILGQRLDDRVDKMLDRGLLQELTALKEQFGNEPDYERGSAQAIGFKEFRSLLYCNNNTKMTNELLTSTIFRSAVEEMKTATRRYAKKQTAWIEKKLMPWCTDNARMYRLSSNFVDRFDDDVVNEAFLLADAFLKNDPLPKTFTETVKTKQSPAFASWKFFGCEDCEKTVHGDREWQIHLKSKPHRKTLQLKKSSQWPFILQKRKETVEGRENRKPLD